RPGAHRLPGPKGWTFLIVVLSLRERGRRYLWRSERTTISTSEQLADRLARGHQLDGPAELVGKFALRIDTKDAVDGGQNVAGPEGAIVGLLPPRRRRADHQPAAQPAAGE